jgi:F0F1-type ATP synthase epsilon subunit
MNQDLKLLLTVRNREQVLINEEVKSITSYNDKGVFDILPEHTNFISLIHRFVAIRRLNGENLQIRLENGIMRVYREKIDVFLGLK